MDEKGYVSISPVNSKKSDLFDVSVSTGGTYWLNVYTGSYATCCTLAYAFVMIGYYPIQSEGISKLINESIFNEEEEYKFEGKFD